MDSRSCRTESTLQPALGNLNSCWSRPTVELYGVILFNMLRDEVHVEIVKRKILAVVLK